jgi:hypothetical protein
MLVGELMAQLIDQDPNVRVVLLVDHQLRHPQAAMKLGGEVVILSTATPAPRIRRDTLILATMVLVLVILAIGLVLR